MESSKLREILEARLGSKLAPIPEETGEEENITISKESIKYDLRCSICSGAFNSPKTLLCQHTFCHNCLQSLETNKCPLCNRRFLLPKNVNKVIEQISALLLHDEISQDKKEEEENSIKEDLREKIRADLLNEVYDNYFEHKPAESEDIAREMLGIEEEEQMSAPVCEKHADNEKLADNIIDNIENGRSMPEEESGLYVKKCVDTQVEFQKNLDKLVYGGKSRPMKPEKGWALYWTNITMYLQLIYSSLFTREGSRQSTKLLVDIFSRAWRGAFGLQPIRSNEEDNFIKESLELQYEKFDRISKKMVDISKRYRTRARNENIIAPLTMGLTLYCYKIGLTYVNFAITVLNVRKFIESRDIVVARILSIVTKILLLNMITNVFIYFNNFKQWDAILGEMSIFGQLLFLAMLVSPGIAAITVIFINFIDNLMTKQFIYEGLNSVIKVSNNNIIPPPISLQVGEEVPHQHNEGFSNFLQRLST